MHRIIIIIAVAIALALVVVVLFVSGVFFRVERSGDGIPPTPPGAVRLVSPPADEQTFLGTLVP